MLFSMPYMLEVARERAVEPARDTCLDLNACDRCCRSYGKTSCGADLWQAHEHIALPAVATSSMLHSVQQSVQTLAWPIQILLNFSPCLGKPGKHIDDYRLIASMPIVYRMYSNSTKRRIQA